MWELDQIEAVLTTAASRPEGWMTRWLEVLISATEAGTKPKVAMPPLGFGDPVSYGIIEEASTALHVTGAVRHGAECFNFLFPQDLDEELLVCYDGFMGPPDYHQVPWQYLPKEGLLPFLRARIKEGYAVPLNPKWVLCDGWYDLFEQLLASESAKSACDAWYPPDSGVRERIREIHARFPQGFRPSAPLDGVAPVKCLSADEAEWVLRRRECLRNAKKKLRAFSVMMRALNAKKKRNKLKRAFTCNRLSTAPLS